MFLCLRVFDFAKFFGFGCCRTPLVQVVFLSEWSEERDVLGLVSRNVFFFAMWLAVVFVFLSADVL